MFNIPIALIFFNRPDKLRETFKQIQKIKPRKLFLIQDGARDENDQKKIMECRKIVDKISWDCEVYKDYSDVNLGCGLRPATGITWAFSKVNELIIIEDDCVVDLSFFPFCEKMLHKYQNNSKIMLISGMNLLDDYKIHASYLFSQVCTIGAWATWKKVWEKYDFEIKQFDNVDIKSILKKNIKYSNVINQKFWAWNLTREKIKYQEKIDWWDYQLHFLLYLKNGLGIVPNKNLVKNIGFGQDATNVSDENKAVHFKLNVHKLEDNLIDPKEIICDDNYDQKVYELQKIKINRFRVFLSKIKRKVLRFKRRIYGS